MNNVGMSDRKWHRAREKPSRPDRRGAVTYFTLVRGPLRTLPFGMGIPPSIGKTACDRCGSARKKMNSQGHGGLVLVKGALLFDQSRAS